MRDKYQAVAANAVMYAVLLRFGHSPTCTHTGTSLVGALSDTYPDTWTHSLPRLPLCLPLVYWCCTFLSTFLAPSHFYLSHLTHSAHPHSSGHHPCPLPGSSVRRMCLHHDLSPSLSHSHSHSSQPHFHTSTSPNPPSHFLPLPSLFRSSSCLLHGSSARRSVLASWQQLSQHSRCWRGMDSHAGLMTRTSTHRGRR